MATDLQGDPQTPILPPGKFEFLLFWVLQFLLLEFRICYFWSFEVFTCGRSSYSLTLSRATLSDSSSPAILVWKNHYFHRRNHYNLLFAKWSSQIQILRPDCPSKAINHLHGIRDREGNHASAEGVPENRCEDLWIFQCGFSCLR